MAEGRANAKCLTSANGQGQAYPKQTSTVPWSKKKSSVQVNQLVQGRAGVGGKKQFYRDIIA